MREVVHVLYAHDRGDALGFVDLLRTDIAEPQAPDQALLLKFDESSERFGERTGSETVGIAHAQVDEIEDLDAE